MVIPACLLSFQRPSSEWWEARFVQKYLGEGPRMVRDVFRLAREMPRPSSSSTRSTPSPPSAVDAQTGADREVQRILLELLNQMDGFDQTTNVKVIMATNRADTLDPALLRPGRLDRKIEFPMPDRRQKRLIFSTITGQMNLSDELDLEDYVARPDKISGADINAICQESEACEKTRGSDSKALQHLRLDSYSSTLNGQQVQVSRGRMHAVRENRYVVLAKDFEKGYKNNIKKDESEHEFYK
ncbi:hypothetical protein HPB47_010573 [Ixodes persulcatus]|uniref:Uncharacterized protein n=1 Tax=Ixodes persulcatus TaxID=34615 RepID=A0AC60NYP4_IXOPE|nr:hypothetical protein HPB47_010573 [Ixodes persulcatus]